MTFFKNLSQLVSLCLNKERKKLVDFFFNLIQRENNIFLTSHRQIIVLSIFFFLKHTQIVCRFASHNVSRKSNSRLSTSKVYHNQKLFLSSKSAYYYDFWRSCDTEDWSNDAENTALHQINKLHFNIYYNRQQLFWTELYWSFYCIFDEIMQLWWAEETSF